MPQDVTSALEALYRSDWGRIVAALIRLFGDFDAAEEAAQEAVAAAVDQGAGAGVGGPRIPTSMDYPDGPPQGHRPHAAAGAVSGKIGVLCSVGLRPDLGGTELRYGGDPRRPPSLDFHLLPPG